jgi:hypothetical protein
MSFEEHQELRQAAGTARASLFPMNTVQAADHLRSRGYDCRPEGLEVLVQYGTVRLSQPDTWQQADMETAAEYLEHAEIFTPYAAMCQTLGCRFATYLRALREAAERESQKYGRRVPACDQYFVLHRMPPRDDKEAVVWFTLADDVRRRLERGKEV